MPRNQAVGEGNTWAEREILSLTLFGAKPLPMMPTILNDDLLKSFYFTVKL